MPFVAVLTVEKRLNTTKDFDLHISCIIIHPIFILQVLYIGQPVGMVVAKTEAAARDAAKWIQDNAITYTELQPVLTLDDAIAKKNFFYDHTTYSKAPRRILKVKIYEWYFKAAVTSCC